MSVSRLAKSDNSSTDTALANTALADTEITGQEPQLSSVGRAGSVTGLEPALSGARPETDVVLRQMREVLATRPTDPRILRQVADVLAGRLGEMRHPFRDEIRWLLGTLRPEVVLAAVSARADDPDPAVREHIASIIGERPVQRRAVPTALAGLLCDPVLEVRRAAVGSLCQFHIQAWQPLSAELASLLRVGDRRIREVVLSQVRRLPPQPVVITAVTELLTDPQFSVRWLSLQVLAEAGPLATGAVPALTELLSAEAAGDADLRASAAETLARLGSRARVALPVLLGVLGESATPTSLRWAAAWAVGSVGSARDLSAIRPVLERLLSGDDREARRCGLEAIRRLGPAAVALSDRLRALLADGDARVRIDAARALAAADPGSAESACLPLLLELSRCEDRFVRKAAREAMTELRLSVQESAPPRRRLRARRGDDCGPAETTTKPTAQRANDADN